jgi:hypothetical protein
VVDLETNGTYAALCGGFGVAVVDVSDPEDASFVGTATQRCQRAAFGRQLPGGEQVLYVAHHGDSWVQTPFLRTVHIAGVQNVREIHAAESPDVLFEGLAFDERTGHLYVAAHGGGVRVYSTDDRGIPSLVTTLDGFSNAWKLSQLGDYLYVADSDGGLRVVSIADPTQPAIVDTLATTGAARDVFAHGTRVYVALGGSGVDVFDATDPARPVPVANIDTRGSAQAVHANDDILAVAAWNHAAIYDTDSLGLLGTERTRGFPDFEQDLGVTIHDDLVMVGEWEGLHVLRYHQGLVASDIWLDEDLFSFDGDVVGARAVIVRNLGPLALSVSEITAADDAFTISKPSLDIAPGEADFFEVTFQPPGPDLGQTQLELLTNDPDVSQTRLKIPLITELSDKLGVGDTLTSEFAFLDPNGANQLSGLEGKVVVIAYFALF